MMVWWAGAPFPGVAKHPYQMWLPHLSRLSKGGGREPQTLRVADVGWGSPPQGEKVRVSRLDWGPCFPPIEKRDGWGSLSCGSVPQGRRKVGQL